MLSFSTRQQTLSTEQEKTDMISAIIHQKTWHGRAKRNNWSSKAGSKVGKTLIPKSKNRFSMLSIPHRKGKEEVSRINKVQQIKINIQKLISIIFSSKILLSLNQYLPLQNNQWREMWDKHTSQTGESN